MDRASSFAAQKESALTTRDDHGMGIFTDRVHDCLEMTLVFRALYETCSSADKTVASRSSHDRVGFAPFTSTAVN